jgi:hypothetical protein
VVVLSIGIELKKFLLEEKFSNFSRKLWIKI